MLEEEEVEEVKTIDMAHFTTTQTGLAQRSLSNSLRADLDWT
jgi:hypothetical protein